MKSFAKLLVFVALTLIVLFVTGGSFGGSLLSSTVGNGKLGITTQEILSKLLEVGFALFTSWLGTSAFSKTPWMKMLIETIGPLFSMKPSKTDEEQFQEDMIKLLVHNISQKNRQMTILLCEQLAGENYMTGDDVTPVAKKFPKVSET